MRYIEIFKKQFNFFHKEYSKVKRGYTSFLRRHLAWSFLFIHIEIQNSICCETQNYKRFCNYLCFCKSEFSPCFFSKNIISSFIILQQEYLSFVFFLHNSKFLSSPCHQG